MNIAVLISGHLRSIEKNISSFRNVFDKLNVDIFCHSWDVSGHTDSVWWSKNGDGEYSKIDETDILKYFNHAKKVKIDKAISFNTADDKLNVDGYNAVHSMWEGIYRCYQLMNIYEDEYNKHYDIIIRTRFDLNYCNLLDINEVNDCANKVIYFLPTPHSLHCNLFSDIYFMTNRSIFDKIITFRGKIDNYLYESIKRHNVCEGEVPFTVFLNENKHFGAKVKYSTLKTKIVRNNGKELVLW